MEIVEKLLWIHKSGLRGLLRLYPLTNLRRSFPFWSSITLSSLLFAFAIAVPKGALPLLQHLIEKATDLLPNLFGFSLAGLTIIVTFSNNNLVSELSKINWSEPVPKQSKFQGIIGVFAWGLLWQGIAFVIAIIFDLIEFFQASVNWTFHENIVASTNAIAMMVLSFSLFYSAFLIPQIILNVFTFGQLNHFSLHFNQLNELGKKRKLKISKTQRTR